MFGYRPGSVLGSFTESPYLVDAPRLEVAEIGLVFVELERVQELVFRFSLSAEGRRSCSVHAEGGRVHCDAVVALGGLNGYEAVADIVRHQCRIALERVAPAAR